MSDLPPRVPKDGMIVSLYLLKENVALLKAKAQAGFGQGKVTFREVVERALIAHYPDYDPRPPYPVGGFTTENQPLKRGNRYTVRKQQEELNHE